MSILTNLSFLTKCIRWLILVNTVEAWACPTLTIHRFWVPKYVYIRRVYIQWMLGNHFIINPTGIINWAGWVFCYIIWLDNPTIRNRHLMSWDGCCWIIEHSLYLFIWLNVFIWILLKLLSNKWTCQSPTI